ncbi:MAG TPA: hypothetical protein VMJ10_06145 [Kofleriaceae bacterium]|nr:hypothetical protein [Kofleriaceae bacterium]
MPAYIGNGQPQATKTIWSGLTSWLGGGAPAYKPAPAATPAATSSPSLSASASSSPSATTAATEPRVIAIIVPRGFFPAWDCPDPQQ